MDNEIIDLTKMNMDGTISNLEKRFTSVRAGRANPSSLDGVSAEYYGVATPLKQLATITIGIIILKSLVPNFCVYTSSIIS